MMSSLDKYFDRSTIIIHGIFFKLEFVPFYDASINQCLYFFLLPRNYGVTTPATLQTFKFTADIYFFMTLCCLWIYMNPALKQHNGCHCVIEFVN